VHAYDTVSAAHQGVERYLTFYNQTRPHQALDGQTPDQVYYDNLTTRLTAAQRLTNACSPKPGRNQRHLGVRIPSDYAQCPLT
jgi:hypothetical protein